jgi:hypothetical protein
MILIRFLIISICILYIVRNLARIFLPMLFQSVINKAQQQANQQQQQRYSQPKEKAEPRIKVDYIPQGKKSSVPDSEGEFVDYEEIK